MLKVSGIILCGGESRRMGQDKGLMTYQGQPMVSHVGKALSGAQEVLLNCNQNHIEYEKLGFNVFGDAKFGDIPSGAGPLLGILSAFDQASEDWLLFSPCDTPDIPQNYLERMTQVACDQLAFACVVFDGERRQFLHVLLHKKFKESLMMYLLSGKRRTGEWLKSLHPVEVDFPDHQEAFMNINSMDDWPESD